MMTLEMIIVLTALVVASYTDLKVREVPDWLNFLLIGTGIGIALIKGVIQNSFMPIYYVVLGLGAAFIISVIMFYSGQWGGGDAKMLMGIGAVLGATASFSDFFLLFILNLIFAGAIYGFLWGVLLGLMNWKAMASEFKNIMGLKKMAKIRAIALLLLCIFAVAIIFLPTKELKIPLLIFALLLFLTFYLWIYVKAIEKVCMIKKVSAKELTEGDWIVEDVVVNKKVIASKKDLGVSKEQIEKLKSLESKGKISFVTIKTGIPFIPSFLFAFIITYFFGNPLLYFI